MNDRDDTLAAADCKPSQAKQDGCLYLVPTPIGNLKDMTLRALDVLRGADVIACEDTRVSAKLMAHYDIAAPLLSYHEHNGAQMRPKLLAKLAAGEAIALISDAGTPLISDPGYKLVREAQEAGYAVTPLPGPCAAITALSGAGLASDHFAFLGFLPPKAAQKQTLLQSVKDFPGTLILYESPKRVLATLEMVREQLGGCEVVLARELTKRFEEIVRLPIDAMLTQLSARESLKGEVVLLIRAGDAEPLSREQIDALLHAAMRENGTKQAAQQVARQTGLSKSQLYSRALELKHDES